MTFNADAAELALARLSVAYDRLPDGRLRVPGDLDLSRRGLTVLPDLTGVEVRGDFRCDNNRLTSLRGSPETVGGAFSCISCGLTSLEGGPRIVGGEVFVINNKLVSLKGGPSIVGLDFHCDDNRLASLEGAPLSVGGMFTCTFNPLLSLGGAPRSFTLLQSAFGDFFSWNEVPEDLRLSPATKARLARGQQEAPNIATQAAVRSATVLQAPLHVNKPLRFRRNLHAKQL